MSSFVHAEAGQLADSSPHPSAAPAAGLRRNRFALAGTVLYLLEWVAIVAAAVDVPVAPTASPHAILTHYQGRADALGFAAGWFALVLLGRVLFAAAVASALRHTEAPRWLTTTAVAVMAASVGLEIATYALAAGIAEAAPTSPEVAGLNDVAWVMDQMVMPLVGVSVLCLVAATLRSRLFGRWVHLPGFIGGVLMSASALLVAPRLAQAYDGVGNSGVPFFWIWMIWISVLCWRAPTETRSSTTRAAAPHRSAETA